MRSVRQTLALSSRNSTAQQRRATFKEQLGQVRLLKTTTTASSIIQQTARNKIVGQRLHQRQQSTTRANFLASSQLAVNEVAGGSDQQQQQQQQHLAESCSEISPAQDLGGRKLLPADVDAPHCATDDAAANKALISGKQVEAQLALHQENFVHRHIGPNEAEVREMLHSLGYNSLQQLIDETIPEEIRLGRSLNLPDALSEHELIEQLRELANMNSATQWKSFIGLGYYDCVVPPVILRNVFENPSWTTAYTAYQAEIAQGRLESLMNFQTMVSELTGLDVANASLLDESTAAAEAMQVCVRVDKLKRNKFLVSRWCHPQTRAVVETRASGLGIQVDYFDELTGKSWSVRKAEEVEVAMLPNFKDYCGVLLQYPNSDGFVYDLNSITSACKDSKCLVVVATDLMACTLFKPPGDFEHAADLVVGSAQRFGVPLNFGGPHAGFLACKQKLIRSIPGRVVGLTRDSNGQQAYRFALQTREQHIRRDKATSNICTAQALLANMSAMYAIYHGPEGLRSIARAIHLKTSLLGHIIKQQAQKVNILNDGAFFDTLTLELPGGKEQLAGVRARAYESKINLRYHSQQAAGNGANALDKRELPRVSISLDETTKLTDVFRLARLFATSPGTPTSITTSSSSEGAAKLELMSGLSVPLDSTEQLAPLKRQSSFLTHPTFNRYHSEAQLVRYMKSLASKDISLAHSMIPLGSCTMKLNATSEMLASSWPEFTACHPFQPSEQTLGYAKLFENLNDYLCEITGYDKISFQPNSGAQGEYAGLRVIKAYLESRQESAHRNVCLIPISAHGTNPASAQMAGFQIESVKVCDNGNIDMEHFLQKLNENKSKLACFMITYPSTFGVFEENIKQMCAMVHEAGGQVYLDGANMNAQVGLCRPGDYGSDVSHLNLHKTFCIPHGGGGPGAGPIGVKSHLVPFLPSHPLVSSEQQELLSGGLNSTINNNKQEQNRSFGTVSSSMWGSPAILPISWSYIRLMSRQLRRSSEIAILNANYMRKRLESAYKILYKGSRGNVAHEFILDCRPFKKSANIEANDIAKRLQDFGLHAPTVSWPVSNTLMLEPTESEDKQQLDNYCEALLQIREEISKIESGHWSQEMNPVKQAPHTLQVISASEWSRPYSREQAAFPAPFVQATNKIWPTVGRVDDTYGDTNLFCSCPPVPKAT